MHRLLLRGTPWAMQYSPGHLIALSLGGPDRVENLVPIHRDLNNGTWSGMEQKIRNCLGPKDCQKQRGHMSVNVSYAGPLTRPTTSNMRQLIPISFNVAVMFESEDGSGGPTLIFPKNEPIDHSFEPYKCLDASWGLP